jgi:P-type Cu2+ transporter
MSISSLIVVLNALRLTRMPKPASLQPTLDPQPMPA